MFHPLLVDHVLVRKTVTYNVISNSSKNSPEIISRLLSMNALMMTLFFWRKLLKIERVKEKL